LKDTSFGFIKFNFGFDFRWESQGYFKPNIDLDGPPFVISMPPPNVTGALHMGHAMFVTLEVGTHYFNSLKSYKHILVFLLLIELKYFLKF